MNAVLRLALADDQALVRKGLRALLAQLDTPSKRLLITVDTNENNQQSNGNNHTPVITYSTESRDGGIQQIQASKEIPQQKADEDVQSKAVQQQEANALELEKMG